MKRREFIAGLGSAAALPLVARGQQPERMRRIGVLSGLAGDDVAAHAETDALLRGLNGLGWKEGQNIKLEYRWSAGDVDQMRRYAKELLDLQCDLIVTRATPATSAVLRATTTVPVIFVQVSDPVGEHFVGSIARPGGNATGFTNLESSVSGKWLGLLKEVFPNLGRAVLLYNSSTSPMGGSFFLRSFEEAARSLGVQGLGVSVSLLEDIEAAIDNASRDPRCGIIIMPGSFVVNHRQAIIDLAARHRVPAIYPFRFWADIGGLMSYGTDSIDLFLRAATYVDRVLKGAKPADLPVQAPVKYELVINLKTAKALGIDVPWPLQQRADEVIE
jgi:putative ABC transport system substrate-binding protein